MSHAAGSLLVRAGIIDEVQLRSAIARKRQWGGHLLTHLVRSGMVADGELATALAARFSHDVEHPLPLLIEQDVLDLLPAEFCSRYLLLPLGRAANGGLRLAVADPTDLAALDAVRTKVGPSLEVVVAGPIAIEEGISVHHHGRAPAAGGGASLGAGTFEGGVELPDDEGDAGAAGRDSVEVGDLFASGPRATPARPEEDETLDVGEERVATMDPDAIFAEAELLEEEFPQLLSPEPPATPAPSPADEPTVEPPSETMPTTAMHAQRGVEGLLVLASEPVGPTSLPEARTGTGPVRADTAPTTTRRPQAPGKETATFASRGRSATPDDPARTDSDAAALEDRLARTEALCKELAAELRDLTNLLVEQGVFSREDFREWRKRKW